MCGIAGIALAGNAAAYDLAGRLDAMNAAMVHRGPDDGGTYLTPNGRVGLANRRLAIRDLSPAGHMPMAADDGHVWITYNGEIYNASALRSHLETRGYIFRSHSDTEVILHGYCAWGPEVVQRLRGIFAFAILEDRGGAARLFLARDRLGVKPLYYATTGEAFLFASELTALRASGLIGREMSPVGLVGYLLTGSIPNPWTIYQAARALEPASALDVTLEGLAPRLENRRYWSFPAGPREESDAAGAVEQVRGLLAEAVSAELVSDAPLGAFLSGGLDSSAVVALMRQATAGPIRTCSMVFEEAEFSEAPYARAMAEAAGADHYERVITARDVMEELDGILAAMDQPTIDGVNTYFVSQTAHQAGLTVALSGLGGDELFGGYRNTFGGVPQLLRALGLVESVPGGSAVGRRAIGLLPGRRWSKLQAALMRPASPASAYLARRGLFAPQEVRALVGDEVWSAVIEVFDPVRYIAGRSEQADTEPGNGIFSWTSRAELTTYTCNQLLRDTDVMSMAHSLEVRVPLLDHLLVERVLRLPDAVKANGGKPKALLLEAVGPWLPAVVRNRSDKQGFVFPWDTWMRGPLEGKIVSMLEAGTAAGRLQKRAVSDVWTAFRAGSLHWSRPWALAVLSTWAQGRSAA